MSSIYIHPSSFINGTIEVSSDKSISHRALMFASIALGQSKIGNILEGHDCLATLSVMKSLGVNIYKENNYYIIDALGFSGLKEPNQILNCQNSGTTIRLLSGMLCAMDFFCILDGSEQIKNRPMQRVIKPLSMMNASIFGRKNNTQAPIAIIPSKLKGINFTLEQKSAQVKSAVILASLLSGEKSVINNTEFTRDHTEKMLSFMQAPIETSKDSVIIHNFNGNLKPLEIDIMGDISSAAFIIVAAVLLARDEVRINNVGINPTRIGIINALLKMNANISLINKRVVASEEVADIIISKSNLQASTFANHEIVTMIDEIPILALAATQASGTTIIKDAQELKVKESNRILSTVNELKKLKANIEETSDGMVIKGPTLLHSHDVTHYNDHRLAMMLAIAALLTNNGLTIHQHEITQDSFTGFWSCLQKLGVNLKVC